MNASEYRNMLAQRLMSDCDKLLTKLSSAHVISIDEIERLRNEATDIIYKVLNGEIKTAEDYAVKTAFWPALGTAAAYLGRLFLESILFVAATRAIDSVAERMISSRRRGDAYRGMDYNYRIQPKSTDSYYSRAGSYRDFDADQYPLSQEEIQQLSRAYMEQARRKEEDARRTNKPESSTPSNFMEGLLGPALIPESTASTQSSYPFISSVALSSATSKPAPGSQKNDVIPPSNKTEIA